MKQFTISLIVLFLLSSCASFSGRIIRKNRIKLTDTNINSINGTYKLIPNLSYLKSGKPEIIKTQRGAIANSSHRYISDKSIELDSLSNYSVDLKMINNKKIRFIFKKENVIIDTVEMNGKLRKNGLIHLNNKFIDCNGIPFIFGGCSSDKTRIGLSKNNGLLINYTYDISGAILIIAAAGHSYSVAYHYERIE